MSEIFGGRISGQIDPDLLASLRSVALAMVRPHDPAISSALGAVDVLGRPGIDGLCVSRRFKDVDVFACSHVGVHDDSHLGYRWSQLIYLGPWDGNDRVRHRLHVAPSHRAWEEVEQWGALERMPPGIRESAVGLDLVPGCVIDLDMMCPHWMNIVDSGQELEDTMFNGRLSEEHPALDDPNAYVAGFMSVGTDVLHPMDVLISLARRIRAPEPRKG